MHTNINDDSLSGAAASPHLLVQLRDQTAALVDLKGLGWVGDLDAMREGRDFAPTGTHLGLKAPL